MRGRIFKRRNAWHIDYSVDGERIRRRIGTKGQAQDALAAVKADILRGEYRLTSDCRTRLRDFTDEYLEYVKARGRVWTFHETSLKHLVEFFGDYLLSRITLDSIIAYKLGREKAVSGATINRELAVLRNLLNVAKKKEIWSGTNPINKEDFYPEPRKVHHILTENERRALLAAIDKKAPHLRLAVVIALHTGLRKGEILGLRWADVDFTNRQLIIEKTKGKRPHVAPIDKTVFESLTRARQENKTELVFPSHTRADRADKGKPTIKAMTDIKRAFASARAKAAKEYPALKDMTFHNLRRVCATTLYNSGAQFAAIQALLNHQSPKTTMIYLQVLPESLREASDILERKFGDSAEKKGTRRAPEDFPGPGISH
jgi:integrase